MFRIDFTSHFLSVDEQNYNFFWINFQYGIYNSRSSQNYFIWFIDWRTEVWALQIIPMLVYVRNLMVWWMLQLLPPMTSDGYWQRMVIDIGWLLTSAGYWHWLVINIGWLLTLAGYWHRMVIDISWLLTLAGYWHRMVIDIGWLLTLDGYWHQLVIDIGWLLTSDGYWHRLIIDIHETSGRQIKLLHCYFFQIQQWSESRKYLLRPFAHRVAVGYLANARLQHAIQRHLPRLYGYCDRIWLGS